jgi:hypothetical protein
MSKKLTDTYYEIYGLYFEGGEERTKNIEGEVAELERQCASLKAENDALLEGIKDALNAEYTDVRRMATDWDISEARTVLWNLLKGRE